MVRIHSPRPILSVIYKDWTTKQPTQLPTQFKICRCGSMRPYVGHREEQLLLADWTMLSYSSDSTNVDTERHHGRGVIPPFDPDTGGLPPGDHQATLEEIRKRLGFTPRRRWLLKGLHTAVEAFWKAGIKEIYIDGSFCTEKPDPGDVDGYWVEPDRDVYDRVDPYRIDFTPVFVPVAGKWRMAHVRGPRCRVLLSTPQCRQRRTKVFRCSFGTIARDGLAA